MKRRAYKLLSAVAFVAVPACSKPTRVTEDKTAEPQSAAAPADSATLQALQTELATAGPDKALAAVLHYRPLCDAQGYPLVGNLNRKVPDYTVSAFCAEVRKARSR
jgi:hypothetical protein